MREWLETAARIVLVAAVLAGMALAVGRWPVAAGVALLAVLALASLAPSQRRAAWKRAAPR